MISKDKRLIEIPKAASDLSFLYENPVGRFLLKGLTARPLSVLIGKFLDSRMSCLLIPSFVEKKKIDMSEYEYCRYRSFNEFFCRRIKSGLRDIDRNKKHMISPCDGLLSVYRIRDGLVLPVKKSRYSVESLLGSGKASKIAKKYEGGYCFVFRLCVNHYHRYCYLDDGSKTANYYIPGKLHTVRPVALFNEPVFTENCREFTILKTENFGPVVQMEVGAMLVGKIENYHEEHSFKRGQEKGRFLYGGSTIILLVEKDRVKIPEWFLETEGDEFEIDVKMGECIGISLK